MSLRIAIVGGGIAGLTAAWLLRRRHEVTLFEKSNRLGGNAYTLDTRDGHAVDLAVAAFGRAGYPRFYELLGGLGIRASISPGSFVSLHDLDTKEGLYLTPAPAGLLAQRFAVLRPSNLGSLLRLRRGLQRAVRMREAGELAGATLEEALARIPELAGNARRLFLCALCLLSSMEGHEVLAAPAEFFVRKLEVHHDVLSPKAFWSVRSIRGGTRRYVAAMAAEFRDRVVLEARLRTVVRGDAGVELVLEDGRRLAFDAVVFACHADQALGLLDEPTERERALLGAWRYKDGRIVVHADLAAFPPRPLMQAYTFLYTERDGRLRTSVNGSLWREPGVRRDCPWVSSQHPNFPIRAERIEFETVLRTPIFDFASCRTIPDLPSLNGVRRAYYCGSHFGHGLHEDAVVSAIAVARALGVEC
jgi:predicted NAD/FAD-binding protein